MEANIVKSRIESSGIHCVLFNENLAGLTSVFNQTTASVKLKIAEKDLAAVLEMLDVHN